MFKRVHECVSRLIIDWSEWMDLQKLTLQKQIDAFASVLIIINPSSLTRVSCMKRIMKPYLRFFWPFSSITTNADPKKRAREGESEQGQKVRISNLIFLEHQQRQEIALFPKFNTCSPVTSKKFMGLSPGAGGPVLNLAWVRASAEEISGNAQTKRNRLFCVCIQKTLHLFPGKWLEERDESLHVLHSPTERAIALELEPPGSPVLDVFACVGVILRNKCQEQYIRVQLVLFLHGNKLYNHFRHSSHAFKTMLLKVEICCMLLR